MKREINRAMNRELNKAMNRENNREINSRTSCRTNPANSRLRWIRRALTVFATKHCKRWGFLHSGTCFKEGKKIHHHVGSCQARLYQSLARGCCKRSKLNILCHHSAEFCCQLPTCLSREMLPWGLGPALYVFWWRRTDPILESRPASQFMLATTWTSKLNYLFGRISTEHTVFMKKDKVPLQTAIEALLCVHFREIWQPHIIETQWLWSHGQTSLAAGCWHVLCDRWRSGLLEIGAPGTCSSFHRQRQMRRVWGTIGHFQLNWVE